MIIISFLLALVFNALVIFLVSFCIPGVKLSSFFPAFILAGILAIVNSLTHQFLISIGIDPGFFFIAMATFLFCAVTIWLVGFCLPGFVVDSIYWAFIFAFVLAIFNAVIHKIVYLL